ncbi:MAG: hypothetical protein JST40_02780 [Armatimonadetes bacterium]|nr:hypothetical protein [Armatimonadota bacterium]
MDKKISNAGPEWFFLAALFAPAALQASRPLGMKIAKSLTELGELLQLALEEQERLENEEGEEEFSQAEAAVKVATAVRSASRPSDLAKSTFVAQSVEETTAEGTKSSPGLSTAVPPRTSPSAGIKPKVEAPVAPSVPLSGPAKDEEAGDLLAEFEKKNVPAAPAPKPVIDIEAEEPKPIKPAMAEAKAPEAPKPVEPIAEVKAPEPPKPVVPEFKAPEAPKPVEPIAEVKAPEPPKPVVPEFKAPEAAKPVEPVAELKAPEPSKPVVPEVKTPEAPKAVESAASAPVPTPSGEQMHWLKDTKFAEETKVEAKSDEDDLAELLDKIESSAPTNAGEPKPATPEIPKTLGDALMAGKSVPPPPTPTPAVAAPATSSPTAPPVPSAPVSVTPPVVPTPVAAPTPPAIPTPAASIPIPIPAPAPTPEPVAPPKPVAEAPKGPSVPTPPVSAAPSVSAPGASAPPVPTPVPAQPAPAVAPVASAPAPTVAPAPAPAPTPVPSPAPVSVAPPSIPQPGTQEWQDLLSTKATSNEREEGDLGTWDFAEEKKRRREMEQMGLSVTPPEIEEDATMLKRGPGSPQSAKAGFRSRLQMKLRRPAPKPKMSNPKGNTSAEMPEAGVPATVAAPPARPTVPAGPRPGEPTPPPVRNRFTVPEDIDVA